MQTFVVPKPTLSEALSKLWRAYGSDWVFNAFQAVSVNFADAFE